MAQKILSHVNGKLQSIKVGSVTGSGTSATIDNTTVCKITFPSVTILAGNSDTFTVNSDLITTDTIFFPGIIECNSGYPVIAKIVALSEGVVYIEILNVGGQGSYTADIINEDITIKLIII